MTMHLPGLRRTRPQLWGTVRWIRPLDGRQGGLSASISIGMDLGDMAHPPVARLTLDGIVESKFCWLLSAATAHGLDPAGGRLRLEEGYLRCVRSLVQGIGAPNATPPPRPEAEPRGGGAVLRLETRFPVLGI